MPEAPLGAASSYSGPAASTASPLQPLAKARRTVTNIYIPEAIVRPTSIYQEGVGLPRGIIFVVVGGEPGSGTGQVASQIIDELDGLRISKR